MRRALALCASLGLACAAAPPGPAAPATPTGRAPRLARECPDAPALDLHALDGDAPGDAFGAGGHVLSATVAYAGEPPTAAVVGELDVKGAEAFEARTRALALANYASAGAAGLRRMGLVLHGRVVASVEVRSAMRGRRFRFALGDARALDALDAELALAVADDRRCFPGR